MKSPLATPSIFVYPSKNDKIIPLNENAFVWRGSMSVPTPSNIEQLILDSIKGIEYEQKNLYNKIQELDKKMDLHVQDTANELRNIQNLDDQQNKILDQHIEGVNTLKKMHKEQSIYFEQQLEQTKNTISEIVQQTENEYKELHTKTENRLGKLETPHKSIKWFLSVVGGLGLILGTIYSGVKLVEWLLVTT